jgi:hypothetical protein
MKAGGPPRGGGSRGQEVWPSVSNSIGQARAVAPREPAIRNREPTTGDGTRWDRLILPAPAPGEVGGRVPCYTLVLI